MPWGARKCPHSTLRQLIGVTWLLWACSTATASASSDAVDCVASYWSANGQIKVADQISACTRLIEGGASEKSLPDVYRFRGAAYLQTGDTYSAIRDFSEAINRRVDFADAYQNRGQAKFKRGEYESALADVNQAIGYDGNSASYYNLRGAILNEMGNYDRAIVDFGKSIQIDKSYANSYNNRGYAYQRKRLSREALDDYTKAISLAPEVPRYYIGRASVKIDTDKLADAIADLDQAIRLDPKNSEAFYVRGEAKRLLHNLVGAMSDGDEAVRLSPNNDMAYVNRALVFRDRHDYARAIADLDQAIVINPNNGLAYANRGEAQRLTGDLDQSVKDLDKAVELNPKSPLALSLRGDTLRAKREFGKAIEDYDAANHFVSDFVPAFVGRGLALQSRGDLEGARAEFEKALKLPSDADRARAVPAQAIAREQLNAVNDAIKAAADEKAKRTQEENDRIAQQKREEEARAEQERQRAEPPLPDQGIRVALVIGMSKYESVPALANPDRDAEGVAETLKAIGFNSVTLVEDASRSKLAKALSDFEDIADNADWALVYYAGHGIEFRGQNYLIPVDAKLATDRDAEYEAVPLDSVLERIHNAHQLQLVILDACRNNPFPGTRGIGRGLARIEPDTPNELVVYAAEAGKVAADGENSNHSPFSAALIARLKEPRVEITRVFRNVSNDVYSATKTQRPFVYGNSLQDFYFNVK